jgi:hypothetical protein
MFSYASEICIKKGNLFNTPFLMISDLAGVAASLWSRFGIVEGISGHVETKSVDNRLQDARRDFSN